MKKPILWTDIFGGGYIFDIFGGGQAGMKKPLLWTDVIYTHNESMDFSHCIIFQLFSL